MNFVIIEGAGGILCLKYFIKMIFFHVMQEQGITLSEWQKQQFSIYKDMLVEWNQKMNLTAIVDEDEIYEKHFLDSILPSFDINIKGSFCDVGAGAGFPSIPLKIVYPELKITIVETLGKRVTFLKALCEALKLDDVACVHARAEDYANNIGKVLILSVQGQWQICLC